MRTRWLVGPFALAFATTIACSSSDESAAMATDDAGASADGAASTQDGASDGGSSRGDGGGADAAAGPFCASLNPQPSLCEDFDDGTLPTVGDTQIDTGGAVAIDPKAARSAPNGLRVMSAPASGGYTNALLRIPADGPAQPTRFLVGFALRLDAAAPKDGILVVARAFLGATHQITIELASADGPVVREIDNGVEQTTKLAAVPAAKTWIRYELDFDLGAKKLTVRANGAPSTATLGGAAYDLFAANLGLTTDASSTITADYDDVVLDLK